MVWNFHPIVGNKINLEIHSIEGEPSNIVSVAVNEVKFHIEDKIICLNTITQTQFWCNTCQGKTKFLLNSESYKTNLYSELVVLYT